MASNSKGRVTSQTTPADQKPGFLKELWHRHDLLLSCLLLAGAVLWAFLPALSNDFTGYDDPDYVTSNVHVQRGLTAEGIRWAFTSVEAANWHPLTWISHQLDVEIFGLEPWGHHFSNILLHLISTILLFVLLRQSTGASGRSLAVALLFGVHPLRAESVAWVAERKDVLSAFFFFLSLWAYITYAQRSAQKGGIGETRSPRLVPYLLSLVALILGLLSKPMLVTLPFVLLLLDVWPLRRWSVLNYKRLLIEKTPHFAAAGLVSAVTFLTQKHGGAVNQSIPLIARIENAPVAVVRYLAKLFWPLKLAPFYPPELNWSGLVIGASVCFLILVSAVMVWQLRARPWAFSGWYWFVGMLVPVIGLIQVGEQSMADRYSYLPSVGILVLLVWGVNELTGAAMEGKLSGILVCATGVTLALLTRVQVGYWKDTETLFRHALTVTEHNYLAHYNLGTALEKQNRLQEALQELKAGIDEKPNYAEAYNNLGITSDKLGNLEEALSNYATASRLRANYADPHNNRGVTLEKLGRSDEAMEEYQTALKLRPDYADARYNLGVAYGRQGKLELAAKEFETLLRLQPNLGDVHNNLAVTLDRQGKLDEAMVHYREAVRLNPGSATAHFNLGVAFARKGNLDQAVVEFQTALEIKPDYSQARQNLAAALELKKQRQ